VVSPRWGWRFLSDGRSPRFARDDLRVGLLRRPVGLLAMTFPPGHCDPALGEGSCLIERRDCHPRRWRGRNDTVFGRLRNSSLYTKWYFYTMVRGYLGG